MKQRARADFSERIPKGPYAVPVRHDDNSMEAFAVPEVSMLKRRAVSFVTVISLLPLVLAARHARTRGSRCRRKGAYAPDRGGRGATPQPPLPPRGFGIGI